MFVKKVSLIKTILALFFLSTTQANAQNIINEVFPAPTEGNEWIELYNPTNQPINLQGWLVTDQLSSPSTIARIENQTLLPLEFLILELTSAKLNNSTDGVSLINPMAEIVDQMSYPNTELGLSWSRTSSNTFELTQSTKNALNLFPSPSSSPSPLPSPTPSPSSSPNLLPPDNSFQELIIITEFSACPNTGEKEWIKLLNSDQQSHSISNWKIRDINNQTRQLELTLAAGEEKSVSWSGSLLNNNGDEFSLENELGESWQNIKYDACKTNTSYINLDQKWTEIPITTTTTDRNKNNIPADPNRDNATPSADSFPAPLKPPFSPSSTKLPMIEYDSNNIADKSKLTRHITKKLPKRSWLSVILGGSWLLFSSSWKIYGKIFHPRHPD